MNQTHRHIIEYLIFLIVCIIDGFLFRYLDERGYLRTILLVIGINSLIYIGWGIIHHKLEGRLTAKIAGEYTVFALLGLLLLILPALLK